MIPKKLYISEIEIDVFDEDTDIVRAWVANRLRNERMVEYTDLSQVWHGISEEPKFKAWFIAQIGENAFDTFVMEMDKNNSWGKME